MLGGSAPEVVTAPSAASAASSDPAASEAAAKERVKLDQDKPATNIQVITFYTTLLSALFDFSPLLPFCQWVFFATYVVLSMVEQSICL